jgi:hypothetical protein
MAITIGDFPVPGHQPHHHQADATHSNHPSIKYH